MNTEAFVFPVGGNESAGITIAGIVSIPAALPLLPEVDIDLREI